MHASTPLDQKRRYVACALGVIVIVAGCVAQAAPSAPGPSQSNSPSPLGSPSPTPPLICDDNPGHYTPMPADCVVPTEKIWPTFYLPRSILKRQRPTARGCLQASRPYLRQRHGTARPSTPLPLVRPAG